MTQATPEPLPPRTPAGRSRQSPWTLAAGAACLLHALVLLSVAAFYGLELARGEGSNTATVATSGVLILVMAALLAVLARVWFRGSARAAVPTFVWNGLLIPVVVALYGADETAIATAVLALVVVGVVTAVGALATRSAKPSDNSPA